jgi:hypothetical protein
MSLPLSELKNEVTHESDMKQAARRALLVP